MAAAFPNKYNFESKGTCKFPLAGVRDTFNGKPNTNTLIAFSL